ncbi:inter alpha-trypsin inhibitor, heavy chain 4-like [Iris pallida]|uniref:Inter alpha-trypsin inhibitor, heavy chain 4-like n=1 Tax=Iris pallida TaxID=29817 RepID=A0AAX6DTL3_IRIPA|nr:inter alpha-trypsin inhibitor, heavy chain 4-like [Iris pallida]
MDPRRAAAGQQRAMMTARGVQMAIDKGVAAQPSIRSRPHTLPCAGGTFHSFVAAGGGYEAAVSCWISQRCQAVVSVCAKQQIDLLTTQAWFSGSKQLEDKVVKLSVQTGIPSEYTYMILLEDEEEKQDAFKQRATDPLLFF